MSLLPIVNVRKLNRLSLLVLTFLLPLLPGAQVDQRRLDSLFHYLSNSDLATGSMCISQYGKVIYQHSFGKDQTPATEYRIGSITKVFTAVLTYQLVDANRLALNDRLNRLFPDLPNSGEITIAELLGNRSGLANFTSNTDFDSWKDQPKTHAELLDMIKKQKPDFAPGSKADYNNSNYLLLGYIIEKLYGKPYKTVVNERIIRPLGLKATYYGQHQGFDKGEAASYKYFDSTWKIDRAVYLDNFGGAGALISTPQDLCTFITALFKGKLISTTSLGLMKTIQDGYGKGLFPYGDAEHSGFGHNGKTEGFGSSIQYYPAKDLAIAYCTNGEVFPKSRILEHIFKACFLLPDTLETFKTVILDSARLVAFTGTYSASSGMQLTSRLENDRLVITARGKDFALTPISPNEFWNKSFGFFFYFGNQGQKLLLQDVDDVYELHRQ